MTDGKVGNLGVSVDLKGTVGPLCKSADKLLETIARGIGSVAGPLIEIERAWAQSIVRKMNDSTDHELERRALARVRDQEMARQRNIERIVASAAQELPESVAAEQVDPDWTTRFLREAQDVSAADLQALWAKLLAAEVQRPGAISRRTLTVARDLSHEDAKLFATLANLVWSHDGDAIVAHIWKPMHLVAPPAALDLNDYGVKFDDVLKLVEAGLVLQSSCLVCEFKSEEVVKNCGREYKIVPCSGSKCGIPCLVLTEAGAQLASVCSPKANAQYVARCAQFFEIHGGQLIGPVRESGSSSR